MTREILVKMPMSKKQKVYQRSAVEFFQMELLLSCYTKKEKISPYYYHKANLLFS